MARHTKWVLSSVVAIMALVQLACSGTVTPLSGAAADSPSATPVLPSSTPENIRTAQTNTPTALPTATLMPTHTPGPAGRASATPTFVAAATPTRLPTQMPTQSIPPTPPFSTVTQLDQWALLMAPSNYSPATTSLVFRVKACATCKVNDPRKISDANDGKGIKNVEFVITKLDAQGNPIKEVYRNKEDHKFYCAFGGGEPICNVFVFADNPKGWPGKNEPFDGDYQMTITVRPTQGDDLQRDVFFAIKLKK